MPTRRHALVLAATKLTIATAALAQGTKPTSPTASLAPLARVTLQLDSVTVARFSVRTFDLGITRPASPPASAMDPQPSGTTEIQLVKQAGPFTTELIGVASRGDRLSSGTVEVLDSLGQTTLTIRLIDVEVLSDHVVLSGARVALEQQRLSHEESLAQLAIEYQAAQRDLATAEELGKSRATTRLDLARARERSSELQQRMDLAKQRGALLTRQIEAQGLVDETLILRAGHVEIDGARNVKP